MLFDRFCAEYGISDGTRSVLGNVLLGLLETRREVAVPSVDIISGQDAALHKQVSEGIGERKSE